MTLNLNFTKFKTPIKVNDNCTVLDVGSGAFPRYIEVRMPGDDGARRTVIWDGSINLAVNDIVICHEYPGSAVMRVVSMGGSDSGAGKIRVSDVWESDFGAIALQADADGNLTLNGARTLTIPSDLIHAGDTDTKLSFTDDKVSIDAGGLNMLALTETTQDLVEIGDVAGVGDVDINFNNGQIFLQGSDGFLGVNDSSPSYLLDIAGNARIQSSNRLKLGGTGSADESVDLWGSTSAGTFNYLELQTPQANERTVLRIAPKGSAGNPPTALEFYGTDFHADTTNWERLNIRSSNSGTYLISTQANGTGTLRPLQLTTDTSSGTGINIDTNQQIGIGTASPQGILHSYDTISGFLLWEYDGLDATVRTVISNGTGDVLYRLHAAYVLRDSAGATNSNTADVDNSSSVNLTVGTNTVRLRVNADGSTDVARTAGSDTIKIALTLRWL